MPNKLSFRTYSEKIPESQYFKENNCKVQWKSGLHPCLMIAQARQSVTKWISHLSLPHEGTSFMFFFPNQGNHMLKTLPKQHNPHCKVKCWETEVSFPLVLTLSSSLHDCCLLACGQRGCSQISQDHRDARVCCPRGCSCQLLHKPEGRQGAGKGGRRIKAHLKAPWGTASQPFFCHRHIL